MTSLLLALVVMLGLGSVPPAEVDQLLVAIATVESSNNPNAVGDAGKAIGVYQIHKVYWQDAVEFDKTLGGSYQDCYDPDYARRVVLAYMGRYAPKNATAEDLARLHNGGGGIFKKKKDSKAWKNTTKYWAKVQKELLK